MVGLMIAVSAYRREESRGGHYRSDFPATLASGVPSSIYLAEAFRAARDIIESQTASAML
jgi:L-aspartate oxidase